MSRYIIRKAMSVMALLFGLCVCASVSASAQTHRLSGTVSDRSGVPVIGASILVEGTTIGVVTDENGKYSFESISPDASIIVSCLGYMDVKRNVGNVAIMDFTLQEDAQMLEEVVMIGYGVQKKRDITGSISSVDGAELSNRPVETVQQALSGKVAGVQVFSATGAPGEDPQIRVRGLSSKASGASNPLYVVDGLKVSSIAYLDPSMIESMEVLKDGASAAIYGAEAGNGVVLITTKSGEKGKGRIFYDFSYGFNSLAKRPDLMNARQWVEFQKAGGNSLAASVTGWDGVTDVDWFEELYGDGGHIQKHTLGVEGGNDKGSIYAAMSYLDNDGIYYGNKDYLKRITLQVNAKYNIKPWLEFMTNNSISYSNYSKTGDGINKNHYNSPYLYSPVLPAFYDKDALPDYMVGLIGQKGDNMFMKNEDGDYVAIPQDPIASRTNPLTWYYSQNSKHKDFAVRGITGLNLKPIDGLTITTRLGYNIWSNAYSYYGLPVYFAISAREKQTYNASTSLGYGIDWENFVNYTKTFCEKHTIYGMVGMAYHYGWSANTAGSTDSFTGNGDNFHYLDYSASDAQDSVSGNESENAHVGYFGRIGYSYDDRYSVQVNFRADAFDLSKLAPESRWGYFPSVSVGWGVSNEPFMRNVSKKALSFLKLRASYGENGNINVLGGFPYASSLNTGNYYPLNGGLVGTISPSDVLANPELRWETSKQWDAGIDARFLNDRLSFTMDWYTKNTTGQLLSMTSPLTSGTTSVTRNVGLINNRGFEFDLGWKDTVGDFFYSINANLATLHNEVVDMGDAPRWQDGASEGLVSFDEGQPVFSFYGYKYMGVNPEDGSAVYFDADDNGSIDEKDKVHLGSPIPDFTYGVTVNLAWKGLDLTVFGSGSAGNELMFNTSVDSGANRPAELWTESWSVKGAGAKYPKPAINDGTNMYYSDMQMYSGSYFKIKQIALGYSLPSRILEKALISQLRLYVSLDNFFCFTRYPGMDPEAINATSAMGMDYGNVPAPKTVTVGVNLAF